MTADRRTTLLPPPTPHGLSIFFACLFTGILLAFGLYHLLKSKPTVKTGIDGSLLDSTPSSSVNVFATNKLYQNVAELLWLVLSFAAIFGIFGAFSFYYFASTCERPIFRVLSIPLMIVVAIAGVIVRPALLMT